MNALIRSAAALVLSSTALAATPAAAQEADAVARGRYLVHAAGCISCHTDEKSGGAFLAGGRALETPFGTFHAPNITPDSEHGLGAWREADFLRALHDGESPDGEPYYPAFPYPSYTGLTEADARDLWAYLKTVPPVAKPDVPHDLAFPFSVRAANRLWQAMFFEPGRFAPDPARDETWNRGAYLVRHLGHCGECHSPRGLLGAVDRGRELAGNPSGPEGKKVPNITPDADAGIGEWAPVDITFFLKTGFLPDGDVAGGAMEEVIRDNTSHLSDGDREAIAAYLKSLPPLAGP